MSYPYQPPPTFPQAPPASAPYAPSPMPVVAPPNASGRVVRTAILVAVSLIFVLALFNFLPGMVAQGVRAAYPRVQAVISGAPSGNQIAVGQSVTFSATGSTGKDLTYLWAFSDTSSYTQTGIDSSVQPTVTKTFTTPTRTMQVTLTVTDPLYSASSGADHTSSANLTLSVLPPPPVASFTWQQSSYYNDVLFNASNSTGNNLQYQWDFGDPNSVYGNTASYSEPSHYYSAGGSFVVKLTVTDDFGQSNTTTQTINVVSSGA